ncbi:MAG: 30S ribosomal protein S20 [Gammaproteobacteria bacterium]
MANIASAKKRTRQAFRRRIQNYSQRSLLRTQIKKVVTALAKGDKEAAVAAYREAIPVIDKMINKGIIHRNKAARHKSRLNKQIQAL